MGLKTIIDPDGDLQISVTWGSEVVSEAESEEGGSCPETLELRVSSHVLMLASPVFKVMFTGRFKEAVGLTKKRAVSKPYELDLPEDDAEAVQILFFVLHFNFAQVPERPSISCLEKLAVLCDKYQCTNAIKYCGKVWLQAWIHEVSASTAVEDICRLIVFAYVADFPQEFTAATWLLCLHHKGPIASGDTQVRLILAHPLLHPDLANYIDAKRMECCEAYHTALMAPVNRTWETMHGNSCFRAAKAVAAYFKLLRSVGILPYDLVFSQHTFSTLLSQGRSLGSVSLSQFQCSHNRCRCDRDISDPEAGNLSASLIATAAKLQDEEKRFVCLDCIKTDGKSRGTGLCRISHSQDRNMLH